MRREVWNRIGDGIAHALSDLSMKTVIITLKSLQKNRESLGAIKTLYVMVKGVLTPISGSSEDKVARSAPIVASAK